ncbi:MAG: hypothetical protein ACI81P_002546, partial [Neolewinella sp.]
HSEYDQGKSFCSFRIDKEGSRRYLPGRLAGVRTKRTANTTKESHPTLFILTREKLEILHAFLTLHGANRTNDRNGGSRFNLPMCLKANSAFSLHAQTIR